MTIDPNDTRRQFFVRPGTRLADFILSNRYVDVIEGPLGSGKTHALCARIMRHIQEQRPSTRDGLRKTRWAVIRNCFDDETEILTERRGWVLFHDLDAADKVAQLRDGNLEFVLPVNYYVAPYVGEMIGFENEGADFKVTPDHRMWVSKVSKPNGQDEIWGDYGTVLAKDAYEQYGLRVRRDAAWAGIDPGRSVAFCEWLGLWFAEGYAGIYPCSDGVTRRQCIITACKAEGIEYAKGLFAAAGLPMSVPYPTQLRLLDTPATRPLIVELAECGKATTKCVPQWLKEATPKHIAAFLKGFIAGDGHVNSRGVTVAFTSSVKLADNLQELALRAGMVANLSSRDRRGEAMCVNGVSTTTTAIEWAVTFVGPAKARPRLKVQGYAKRYRGWYRERYAGNVYCIEVPSHVVYVRRKGKAFWCGQSYPDLKRSTIRTWNEIVPEHVYGRMNWSLPPSHRLRFGDVLSEIDFLALDKPEDVRKLRSAEYTGIAFNELQYIDKELFDEATSRLRYPAKDEGGATWHGILCDANAPDEDHWLAIMTGQVDMPPGLGEQEELALGKWPEEWGFHLQPPALLEQMDAHGRVIGYEPNPAAENAENLNADYYPKQLTGKTKAWIDSRLMVRVVLVVDGSPVWPMFRVETHVASTLLVPNPLYDVDVGLDFGRQPAAVFGQSINNRALIQHERLGHNEGAVTFAPKVARYIALRYPDHPLSRFRFWGDPKGQDKGQADERTAYDIFRANGMHVRPAPNLKQNMISTRVDAVANLLNEMYDGRPRFALSPACPTLKVAMAGRYHNEKDDIGELRPCKDRYSNPSDALQYLVLGMGEGRRMVGRPQAGEARPVKVYRPMQRRRVTA